MKNIAMMLVLLPWLAHAGPQLNIGGLYDYLDEGRSTLLKRVRNGGDATAFVKVSVSELVYDTGGEPREVAQDSLPAEQRGLIASPARLIVPAGGLQSVRLLYRGERQGERYFRLRFIPVLPETGEGFDVSAEEAERYQETLKAGVNILAGYGSLLFVRPQQTRFATHVSQQPGHFVVANEGNATVVLDHFNDCQPDGLECGVATKHHVLSGSRRTFEKRPGRTYGFDLIEGAARRRISFEG